MNKKQVLRNVNIRLPEDLFIKAKLKLVHLDASWQELLEKAVREFIKK